MHWIKYATNIKVLLFSFTIAEMYDRLGPVNSNTVNSKFHLIQSFVKIFETFLSFEC